LKGRRTLLDNLKGVGPVRVLTLTAALEVLEQSFLHLELPSQRYDGVFADAVLFHVPRQVLPQVLRNRRPVCGRAAGCSVPTRAAMVRRLERRALRRIPRLATWRALVTAAGFDELDRFYRPPGLPIGRQPWLASVWRKR
jgi:hypothetical protein